MCEWQNQLKAPQQQRQWEGYETIWGSPPPSIRFPTEPYAKLKKNEVKTKKNSYSKDPFPVPFQSEPEK